MASSRFTVELAPVLVIRLPACLLGPWQHTGARWRLWLLPRSLTAGSCPGRIVIIGHLESTGRSRGMQDAIEGRGPMRY